MSKITVKWNGEPTAEELGDFLTNLNECFKAAARSKGFPEDSVELRISSFRYECDGCGKVRPDNREGWKRDGRKDYCPECAS